MIELTLYIGFAYGLALGLFIGGLALITKWNGGVDNAPD